MSQDKKLNLPHNKKKSPKVLERGADRPLLSLKKEAVAAKTFKKLNHRTSKR